MYKTPLTATVFKDFSSCYQHFSSQKSSNSQQAFVYVDSNGVKLVTDVVDSMAKDDDIFALSMAEDGWMQTLALFEAS